MQKYPTHKKTKSNSSFFSAITHLMQCPIIASIKLEGVFKSRASDVTFGTMYSLVIASQKKLL